MANILISCIRYPVASGRYMTDAFRRLGHTVYVSGPCPGNDIWGMKVDEKYIWDEAAVPLGYKPDLCITMDTAYNQTLGYDCPHVIFTVDNHVRNVSDKSYPRYDHYFLAHHDGPAMPVCDCYNAPCTWLPCAYDPTVFTPSPIPMAERPYDVALIGYPYERRVKLIDAMRDVGLNVCAGLGPLYDQFSAVYHHAKISLCVSAAGDVAQRIFETAAMGCIVLTDSCKDFERLKFRDTWEGIIFDSDEYAVETAKELADSGTAYLESLSEIAREWAHPHTWDARAQTILDTMEIK